MSVVFTGTLQGRFTADGNNKTIQLPTDVDWMRVYNTTVSYAAGAGTGAEFYWQRGMTQGRGTEYIKTAGTNALQVSQIAANAGFTLVDSSVNTPGSSIALTGIDNGTPPTVFTANTSSLATGSIVRIYSTVGALQLGGLDFTVNNVVANTSFDLAYMAAIVNANPGAGTYRIIPFDPLYYPRNRTITAITQATSAVVTLSVTHGFTVGQVVRFIIPTITSTYFGMTELDGQTGTITAINTTTNTITVDIDTSSYTAFAFPLTTTPGFTPAQVVPVGENTAEAITAGTDLLGDATVNTGYFGLQLAAGTNSPAGSNNDVIYWVAGKSFSVDNQ